MRKFTVSQFGLALVGSASVLFGCSDSGSSTPDANSMGAQGSEEGSSDAAAASWGNNQDSILDSANNDADGETSAGGTGNSSTEAIELSEFAEQGEPSETSEPLPTVLGDVAFSTPSQAFAETLSVGLFTSLDSAEIRFTTDGSLPTAASPVYDGMPLQLEGTVQLRAQAYVQGEPAGEMSTALYVARNFDVQSDLPLIVIDSYGSGKPEDHDIFFDTAFLVFEPSDSDATLSQLPSLATRAGYHLRGQSSASFDKAPYRIELWDNDSEDADYPLLGMPAEADWALIGPFADRSLIRHAFAYTLGAELGMMAPRYAFAEVYLNANGGVLEQDDYQGVYMVVETIKNNKNRLNLKQLREDDVDSSDLSGGYIFKFDWAASEEPTLDCTGSEPLSGGGFGFGGGNNPNNGGTCWTDLEVVDPTPINAEQRAYLSGYLQTFHDSLHDDSMAEYGQYIDIPSFVDQFIINELTRDIDSYTRSAFYHKERDEPLKAGPLWDYNLTLGVGFGGNREVEGWQWEEREVASDWFRIVGADPEFMALVAVRWQELRQGALSNDNLMARVDTLAAPLSNAARRDMQRWPVAAVSQGIFQLPDAGTWEGQIDVLKQWVIERIAWLDSEI